MVFEKLIGFVEIYYWVFLFLICDVDSERRVLYGFVLVMNVYLIKEKVNCELIMLVICL